MTELSFPHDAIKAMQGIFHVFSSSSRPVHQFMGNPISHPDAALRNGISYKREECFVVGLSWFHISPGERRCQFPSWSWAGWLGKLAFRLHISETSLSRIEGVEVWVEEDDKSLVRITNWEELPDFLSRRDGMTTFLRLVTDAFPLSTVHLTKDNFLAFTSRRGPGSKELKLGEEGYYAEVEADEGTFRYWPVTLIEI
jgi:hypothetical protein